jgi:hypothetical protein
MTINLMPAQIRPRFNLNQAPPPLPIDDALQIKAAEYWLKLGLADEALRELEKLPSRSWKCGWALKTRIAAMGMLRERSEVMVRA